MTYRNRNWTARNYECTNVVAAVSDTAPTHGLSGSPADYWEEADVDLTKLDNLGSCAGVTFYGYL